MRKNTVPAVFDHEIESGDMYIEVSFECELYSKNDGIGSYEYWGSRYYDMGVTYLVLDTIDWNKELFNDKQNLIIQEHIDNNWNTIEELVVEKMYADGYEEEDYWGD